MYNRRIRRPKDQEELYLRLTNKKEFGIFDTYKDIFMLSLVIGFLESERISFNESAEPIPWQVFKERTDEPLINLIAVLDTGDLSFAMNGSEEQFHSKITIAEEYACAGIKKLQELIMQDEKNALQIVIDYIQEFESISDCEELNKNRLLKDLNL
ncbi:DNA phosphorothioation-associated protein 4 [Bacillus sp. SB49]|uniref:DNA phosphorothioation-associated protein 4 n=1 Tax=Bacillus sp. SB49 TaxID=1071080 RepID=UPI0004169526|nr:DNA phosphorothioation-associated protein 4 [Bacillus sp. SB49]QHT48501.1 DNA phosphorothioation-associated protein 4 [Bacillus sp. SB49]